MRIEAGEAFGVDNLISWYGAKVGGFNFDPATGEVLLNGLRKVNAITYIDSSGRVFFGGSIIAGTRRNAIQSTTIGDTSVTLGPFGSNGGLIDVKYSLSAGYFREELGTCPVVAPPQATIVLERLDGSTWTSVSSMNVTATVSTTQDAGFCVVSVNMSNTAAYTDSLQNNTNRTYRATITFNVPMINAQFQNLSIISEEA